MPEPIRVESLPESRQAELVLAAVDAGCYCRPTDSNHEAWFARTRKGAVAEIYPTPAHALAAAALALGLEPRVRVVPLAVADEALPLVLERADDARGSVKSICDWRELSSDEGFDWKRYQHLSDEKLSEAETVVKQWSALARALSGEV